MTKSISSMHSFRRAAVIAAVCILAAGSGIVQAPGQSAYAASAPTGPAADSSLGTYHFLGTGMYTYQNLKDDIARLASRYTGVTTGSIGTTVDGRSIECITIGNPSASKRILVDGTMHGREYIATPLIMRQVKDLLDRQANGEKILDNVQIEFVPMMNPDGVCISQFGINGLTSAAAKQKVTDIINSWADSGLLSDQSKYNAYLKAWKNNVNGVDINQNFDMPGWSSLNDGRNKPASEFYKGPSPESEPETRALANLVNQGNFTEVINYHAQGECIYWQSSLASGDVPDRDLALAKIAHSDTGYTMVGGDTLSTASALRGGCTFKDLLDAKKGIPNITLEVGLGNSPVPETQIERIWQQNQKVLPDIIAELTETK
jgi:g-D-glutamyl-meso-diaminopimelate peptidase